MNLLFISNFYPPQHLGGYELLCHEIAVHLTRRGHQVHVLTSTHGVTSSESESDIYRQLLLQSDIHYYQPYQTLRYFSNRRVNRRTVREVLKAVQPDVVMVWGMWNLSWSVAAEAEALMGSRVVYYLNSTWPADPTPHQTYWSGAGNTLLGGAFLRIFKGPVKWLLRDEWLPCKLRLEHVAVCSRATQEQLRQAGLTTEHYRIIYHGIDVAAYRQAADGRQNLSDNSVLRIVFVGSLLPQKGVHTAIEAFNLFQKSQSAERVTLDILGTGHPDYEDRLHRMVKDFGLTNRVTFLKPIPRSQLPAFLAQYDALVLPSIWEEPMALISQEAMAAGLVLLGTLTGGTKEILSDGVNGLAFEPENAQMLAMQIQRLVEDPSFRKKLSLAGQATAEHEFTLERTLDELESLMKDAYFSVGFNKSQFQRKSSRVE